MGVWSPGPGPTSGDDTFTGDETGETANGDAGNDTLHGNGGDDTLRGWFGNDTLYGGGGNDVLYGDAGVDALFGEDGDDTLYGDGDTLDGGAGNDTLNGNDGSYAADTLTGGDGDDTGLLGAFDSFDGGAGNDTLWLDLTNNIGGQVVDLSGLWSGGAVSNGSGVLSGIEVLRQVYGSSFADTITIGDYATSGFYSGGLLAGAGDDVIYAGALTDALFGEDGNDTLHGGGGNDTLRGWLGNDTLYGDGGDDVLMGEQGVNALYGGDGNDTLIGGNGDTLDGGAGNDTLNGDSIAVADTLIGGGGDDTGRLGVFDSFSGGDGTDTLYLDLTNNIGGQVVDLSGLWSGGTGSNGSGALSGIEMLVNLTGSGFGDTITIGDYATAGLANDGVRGFGGDDVIYAGALADRLHGDGGNDTIYGGAGNDTLLGDAGNDVLQGGAGADVLAGGDGDDTIAVSAGETGVGESIDGGAGADTLVAYGNVDLRQVSLTSIERLQFGADSSDSWIYLAGSQIGSGFPMTLEVIGTLSATDEIFIYLDSGATLDLSGWTFTDWTAQDEIVLYGAGGGETIIGSSGADYVLAGDGNDSVSGGAGNDLVDGGDGNDILSGGVGDDTLNGGNGIDTADYLAAAGGVSAFLGLGLGYGAGAGDTYVSIENLRGSNFDDHLEGDSASNLLSGEGGADTLIGGGGTDTLNGGDGDDTIIVGASETGAGESIDGGAGTDTLVAYGNVDFRQVSLTSIERLQFGADSNYNWIRFAGSQIGSGFSATLEVIGTLGATDEIYVYLDSGATLDLSGWTFTDWTSYDFLGSDPDLDEIVIYGAGGAETVIGSSGTDYVFADDGNDSVSGGGGADYLRGQGGDDTLDGGDGNDILRGGAGVDSHAGGAGIDRVSFYEFGATQGVVASLLTQTISNDGFGNAETMSSIEGLGGGTAFADWFEGDDDANKILADLGDTVLGRGGDDGFQLGAAPALLDGGDGNDTITLFTGLMLVPDSDSDGLAEELAASHGVTVNLATGTIIDDGFGNSGAIVSIENVGGSAFDDTITGDGGVNTLSGDAGNDTLEGGVGADVLDGGLGADTASYETAATGVRADLINPASNTGDAAGDTYASIENLRGSAFDDTLVGDAGSNSLEGGVGNDNLNGGAGIDTLLGGAGGDVLSGGSGSDVFDGGDGVDTAQFFDLAISPNAAGIVVTMSEAGSTAAWNGETDTLISIEGVVGTVGNDTITFDAQDNFFYDIGGADSVSGGAGFDRVSYRFLPGGSVSVNMATGAVTGQNGNTDTLTSIEWIEGSQSNDTIDGDAGDNAINGWGGNDTLSGGSQLAGPRVIDGDGDALGDFLLFSSGVVSQEGNAGVVADLASGTATDTFGGSDTFSGFENLGGSHNADQLFGDGGGNILVGGAGNDLLDGRGGQDMASYNSDAGGVTVDLEAGTATDGAGGVDTLVSIERLLGSAYADVLLGDGGDNLFIGGAGNDVINGRGGVDTVSFYHNPDANQIGDNELFAAFNIVVDLAAGTAVQSSGETDTLIGIENVIGGLGNDTITGDGNANVLNGLAGADTLSGGDGSDTLNGGLGVDSVNGGNGADTFLYAIGDGNGSMNGGADTDTLNVSDGAADSILNANWNGSALTALSGNGLTSIETVTANLGGGVDWLVYAAASAAVTVNLAAGAASGFASIAGIERVVGGSANDTLTGNGLDNRLDGGAGDDTLAGGGGIDTMIGGDGADALSGGLSNDSIQGGAGNDTISWSAGDGRDTIDGGADADTFNATGSASAELGNTTWNGAALTALMDNGLANLEAINLDLGGGIDWLIYNASAAVVVNLATNSASGFASVTNIEKVIGGSANDTLTGNGLDNRLDGLAGADTLDGGAGSDAVLGGDGDDVIYASGGNDSLQGQNGNDTFHWTSTDGRDTFNGGADTDTVNLTGSAVADVADTNWNGSAITGLLNNALVSIETINLDLGAGGSGGDWLRYNSTVGISVDLSAGTATGFASITGVENLIGGTGGDALTGDGGVNKINGNNGDDVITGGAGNDNLTGGVGNDTFVYAAGCGNDTINDFDAWAVGGQDFLDVSAFGINAGNFAARVAIIDTGADTVVRIDNTYFITLKNVSGDGDNVITDADFIFGP